MHNTEPNTAIAFCTVFPTDTKPAMAAAQCTGRRVHRATGATAVGGGGDGGDGGNGDGDAGEGDDGM